jgi:hypothetical protein
MRHYHYLRDGAREADLIFYGKDALASGAITKRNCKIIGRIEVCSIDRRIGD